MAFELPEATTVAGQMDSELRGKRIEKVTLDADSTSLANQGFIQLEASTLEGREIRSVSAKGKWIYVHLSGDWVLLLALETGGRFLYHNPSQVPPAKYHLQVRLVDGSAFTEQIVGWGWAKAMPEGQAELERYPGRLGLSPLVEAEFTLPALSAVLDRGAKKNLKLVLLQQDQIAGIGNGYLQDILYRARLHPKRKAGSLTPGERQALYDAIRLTLQDAVQCGGSEFEVDLYGKPGRYHRLMSEFQRGKPCPSCGTPVEKISVQGSACYICPACQQ